MLSILTDWNWLWQQAVWEWILVPFAGILLAWLRKRNPAWAGIVIYGLGGSAFVAMVLFAMIGRPILRSLTTPDNIESSIKTWADDLSLGIQKGQDTNYLFVYSMTLHSGRSILIGKPKQHERYLQLQSTVILAPEHEALVKKLTPAQMERVTDEINIEMARSKIGFAFMSAPVRGIIVTKTVPITTGLGEDQFVAALDDLDDSTLLATEAIRLALAHSGVPADPARPVTSQ